MNKRLVVLAMVLGLVLGFVRISAAGDTATVNVSATVQGNCKFLSGGSVSFTLDPNSSSDATGTVVQPTFWCTKGSTYTITDDYGANESGTTFRMKDSGTNYIPYSFTYTNTGTGGGRGTTKTMDISSTVLNANFINATAGSYTDTVILTINP